MKTASPKLLLRAAALLVVLAFAAGCASTQAGGVTAAAMKRRMMQLETRDAATGQLLSQERELLTLWRTRPSPVGPSLLTSISSLVGTGILPLTLYLAGTECSSSTFLFSTCRTDEVLALLSATAFGLGLASTITGVIWLSVIGSERRGIEERVRLRMEEEQQDSEPEAYLLPWLVPDGRGGAAGGIGIGLRWGG